MFKQIMSNQSGGDALSSLHYLFNITESEFFYFSLQIGIRLEN
ncbi:Uncharacterized protein dnm_059200 [Desulfonema magnum]|uniref:Uncharacterized protein n=1 Tax=Desulfonema magnum TaxID=45655 RepID=A0A975GRB2_9BACT|nr:Uncharacterized protein dnm_059200 [Desulfonema magnum]